MKLLEVTLKGGLIALPLGLYHTGLLRKFFRVVWEWICLQVVRTADTSDETFGALLAFGKAMKKVTVSCKVWTWGHMTLSQCSMSVTRLIMSQHFSSTVGSSDLLGTCMTFWGKFEQARYVKKVGCHRLAPWTLVDRALDLTCSLLPSCQGVHVYIHPNVSFENLQMLNKNYCWVYYLCVLWPHCRTLLDLLWTDCWCHTWPRQWGCWREVRDDICRCGHPLENETLAWNQPQLK